MKQKNQRSSFVAITSQKDYSKEYYLLDLKQNYAKRKDIFELIKSNNNLAAVINKLNEAGYKGEPV